MVLRCALATLLIGALVFTLVNELAFGGQLAPTQLVGNIAGMCAVGTAATAIVVRLYSGRLSKAAKDIGIWIAIFGALMLGYWLVQ